MLQIIKVSERIGMFVERRRYDYAVLTPSRLAHAVSCAIIFISAAIRGKSNCASLRTPGVCLVAADVSMFLREEKLLITTPY